jgi:succinate-semialdehyde dehydrogenase / glutarate-semialdehyde dehydrogenase
MTAANAVVRRPTATAELYIDGQWSPASTGATFELVNPADGALIGYIASASEDDIARALHAAEDGFARWRATPAGERARIVRRVGELLRERADELSTTMSREQGKPLAQARAEAAQAADYFEWFAEECRRSYGRVIPAPNDDATLQVTRHPLGPVAAFTAWNFPASLPARKLAPAIAAGCSIILKPAEQTPLTAAVLVQACHDAGVPAGVVNLVTGDPERISERLCRSGVIRKITLTGSVPVGRRLVELAAEHVVPLSLELGGHAPVLVFADADVDAVARMCVQSKFRNAGQVCISPSRFYVQGPIYDEFVAAFLRHTESLVVGPPDRPDTDVGPLVNERRLAAIRALIDDAVGKGATVAIGGRLDEQQKKGRYFLPTVLIDLSDEMAVMAEEPFGPVAPILSFDDLADGVAKANATPFGLAAYVFTNDLSVVHAAIADIEAGMIGVNDVALATAEAPFGGVKLSGYGREGAAEGLASYTYAKYVKIAPARNSAIS